MKYRVIAQQTPFNVYTPEVIIVEAENKTEAFLKAFHKFTEQGYNVETDLLLLRIGDRMDVTGLDQEVINSNVPKRYHTTGMLKTLSIQTI